MGYAHIAQEQFERGIERLDAARGPRRPHGLPAVHGLASLRPRVGQVPGRGPGACATYSSRLRQPTTSANRSSRGWRWPSSLPSSGSRRHAARPRAGRGLPGTHAGGRRRHGGALRADLAGRRPASLSAARPGQGNRASRGRHAGLHLRHRLGVDRAGRRRAPAGALDEAGSTPHPHSRPPIRPGSGWLRARALHAGARIAAARPATGRAPSGSCTPPSTSAWTAASCSTSRTPWTPSPRSPPAWRAARRHCGCSLRPAGRDVSSSDPRAPRGDHGLASPPAASRPARG